MTINTNNELLQRGEELLKNSDNKYITIIKLAKHAKLNILQDIYTLKKQSNTKPLVHSIYNFDQTDN
jgi:hypothetical protein|tara:strand:- start:72 stop:272 length:201 start_codon:yes stop_codon:yes gene_type:complete